MSSSPPYQCKDDDDLPQPRPARMASALDRLYGQGQEEEEEEEETDTPMVPLSKKTNRGSRIERILQQYAQDWEQLRVLCQQVYPRPPDLPPSTAARPAAVVFDSAVTYDAKTVSQFFEFGYTRFHAWLPSVYYEPVDGVPGSCVVPATMGHTNQHTVYLPLTYITVVIGESIIIVRARPSVDIMLLVAPLQKGGWVMSCVRGVKEFVFTFPHPYTMMQQQRMPTALTACSIPLHFSPPEACHLTKQPFALAPTGVLTHDPSRPMPTNRLVMGSMVFDLHTCLRQLIACKDIQHHMASLKAALASTHLAVVSDDLLFVIVSYVFALP